MRKIKEQDPQWCEETRRARVGLVATLFYLSAAIVLMSIAGKVFADTPETPETERKWDKPIFYEVVECPTNKSYDWLTWVEDAIAEIEPLTVRFIPSPSTSATNLLIKCSPENWFANQLVRVDDGQGIQDSMNLVMGTTRARFFTESQEMIRADIWLNELWAFNFRQVIRHELGHALGIGYHLDDECDDCSETLMNAFPTIEYWDVYTLAELQNRYGGQYGITDESQTKYTPCLWVDKSLAALFDAEQGFYWTIEENREGFWEVMEYGEADCERD